MNYNKKKLSEDLVKRFKIELYEIKWIKKFRANMIENKTVTELIRELFYLYNIIFTSSN